MATLEIFRGDDKTYDLTITDGNATAIDITGWTVFMTIKETIDDDVTDSNAIISKTVTSHTDAVNGLTSVSLTNTDTDQTPKKYFYDIQTKDDMGNITTITKDSFIIKSEVTRRES